MQILKTLKSMFTPAARVTPAEAADRVRAGTALLIDVREPSEWERGVAQGATLLPLSDLTGGRERWKPFLAETADRELLLYCASGGRSGMAARLLAGEGFRAANAGGLGEWADAGWQIAPPTTRHHAGRRAGSSRPLPHERKQNQ